MKKVLIGFGAALMLAFAGCDTVSSFLQDHKTEIVEQVQNATPALVDQLIDFAKTKEANK